MFDYAKAARYCKEPVIMIEHAWEAASDVENMWIVRHKLESENTPEELRKMRKWYNRPASELYFTLETE